MSGIIGILITVVIAIIASRSGKTPKHPNPNKPEVNPPTGNNLPSFEELLKDLWPKDAPPQSPVKVEPNYDQYEQKASQKQPENVFQQSYSNLETTTQSLETLPPLEVIPTMENQSLEMRVETNRPSIKYNNNFQKASPKNPTTGDFEFDLRSAVIYNEILKPKHLEY